MKDAKGHGSNARGGAAAHQSALDQVGRPVAVSPRTLDVIRAHPEAFSVSPGGEVPTDGYMVSYPGRTQFVRASDLAGPKGMDVLNAFAAKNSDLFARPDTHIGGWTDSKTGLMHLDVSQRQKSLPLAESLARVRNQAAIWSLKQKEHWDVGQRRFRTRDEVEAASPGKEYRTGGKGDATG